MTVPASGRVAVVTGAAGAIGAAVAERLRANGDTVYGVDLRPAAEPVTSVPPGEPRRHQVGAAGVIRSITCDVTDAAAVSAAFERVRAEAGPVQVLVHAAGITGAGTVLDETPEQWRRILETNLTSAYLATRTAIPQMLAAGGGAVVLVASVNARFGGSALSGPAYAASKGGLVTLARFIAREHAAGGITSNAVAPGPHETPMWAALDAGRRERILGMIPGGNGPGDPDDLAATIAHLCSPAARFINGATIDVNGGQWMG